MLMSQTIQLIENTIELMSQTPVDDIYIVMAVIGSMLKNNAE